MAPPLIDTDDLVIAALRDPAALPSWPLPRWQELVQLARRAELLPRLARRLERDGLLDAVPPQPRAHLHATLLLAQAQQIEVRREAEHLRAALAPTGVQPVLLKGAAYVLAELPAMEGRLFSDVDILVPKSRLPEVEAALMANGWVTTHHSDYDQRYYREWMHELPPMQHIHRHTTVDVHHAILPETARHQPDSRLLLASSRSVPCPEAGTGLSIGILAPQDMLLHSMTHLFHNEEHSHALRDLSDLDLLMRHFGADPAFWAGLVPRARELHLLRTLHYGLRYATQLLGTPVPEGVLAEAAQAAPPRPLAALMDRLWHAALRTPPARMAMVPRSGALFALYVRAHWLRMPPALLARHLFVKAFLRPKVEAQTPA